MDDEELLDEIRRGEASEPRPPPAAAPAPAARRRREQPRAVPPWVLIGGVFLLLGAGVVFLLAGTGGGSSPFVYSKLVDEVMSSPGEFFGRELLRVEGQLRRGSVVFVDEPSCEHTFVLERGGHQMPVRFPRCVVPDTFRDDMPMDVVVQGQLQTNGTFLADQVIPRCPSKYEMQQRQESGEEMPHAMPTPRSQS
ncbi:MAG: cytochrome c maturation protein CcmE [Sandaracinaceae bacterium]|nr:cytochrome c maturation protein CcmE [Sandaracinaceae bacterium]